MTLTRSLVSLRFFATAMAIVFFASATLAIGQSGADIYEFSGGADGQWASGTVVFDSSGSLYGVTQAGGLYSSGTVYKLSPPSESGEPWTKTVLYDFMNGADGGDPGLALVFDKSGSLYGINGSGGDLTQCDGYGCGTIYQLTPPTVAGNPWTETPIYTFENETCATGLTMDAAGSLYAGAESSTDPFGKYIFRLSPPQTVGGAWTRTNLAKLSATVLIGNLVFDNKGALYGAIWSEIFKVSPPASRGAPWTLTYIYDFTYNSDPYAGPVFDKGTGHLFGTMFMGGLKGCGGTCGVVYELAEIGGVWQEENIYNFNGRADGFQPMSAVTFDSNGTAYTSSSVGSDFGPGSVIQLVPTSQKRRPWTETTLWKVIGGDYSGPVSTLVLENGNLYGTTYHGGSGYGAVFEVTP